MRKANKAIAERKRNLPDKYKKVDTTINGDAEMLAEKQKQVEKKLYPLRIDQRTVIYERKGGSTCADIDVEKLREMVHAGMASREIAGNFGVSRTTVDKYIKMYNLRNGNKQKNMG